MIAFVIGGAGFPGSHLCDRLLAEGNTVVAFDNVVTGSRGNLRDPNRTRYLGTTLRADAPASALQGGA